MVSRPSAGDAVLLAYMRGEESQAEAEPEPFVTISSSSPSSQEGDGGNTSDSPNTSPEESFVRIPSFRLHWSSLTALPQDESTPLPAPLSATHDTRRAEYHMKDLDAFAKDLQNVWL